MLKALAWLSLPPIECFNVTAVCAFRCTCGPIFIVPILKLARQYPSEPQYCLPASVQAAYLEARKVKRQSASAYGIMVRRVLEAVSRDRGIKSRSLATSLSELVRKEQMSPQLVEAITIMRTLGNASAHNPDRPMNEHHVAIIERFLDALLEHVYLLSADIDFFKQLENIDFDENVPRPDI